MRTASLVGAIVCTASTIALAAPAGRVVRVERGITRSRPPAFCELSGTDDARCFFHKPEVGDILTVFNKEHVVGEMQVVESNDSTTCESRGWEVRIAPMRGNFTRAHDVDDAAVSNVKVDPAVARVTQGGRHPSPSGAGDETVVFGIDGDGDGTTDFELSTYPCDAAANFANQYSAHTSSTCGAMWLAERGSWQRVGQITLQPCP